MVRQTLSEVFAEVEAWFEQPEDLRRLRPTAGGWSIDHVLEHITLTNHFLMLTLVKWVEIALRRARRNPVPEGESDLERLEAIGQRWLLPLDASGAHGAYGPAPPG